MVKSPKIRHSKPGGEPLTIDLSGEDVKRVNAKVEASTPSQPSSANAGPSAAPTSPAGAGKPAQAADAAPSAATAASAHSGQAGQGAASPARADASKSASNPTASASGPKVAAASFSASSAASSSGAASAPAGASFGRDAGKGPANPPPPRAEPKPEVRPQPAPRRSGSVLLAGLLGGVVALGGAGAAWYGGLIQPPAIPAQPAAPVAPDNSAVDALRAELDTLRAAIEELRAAPPPVAAEAPDLTNVNARIESLATLVEDIRAQIAGLGEGAGGAPADAAALAALRESIAALEARVDALPTEGGADLSGLREEIGAASALARQASEAATQAASTAGALAPRIERIEGELTALATKVSEAAEKPGVALAIAASALKAAVDRGQPFVTELDTFSGLAPDMPEVAALRPFAEKGVPTRTDIEADFNDAASAMIAAGRVEDPEAGFFQRLWGSAISVVEVRPIGEVEGDDAAAIVARMEVALGRGDYGRAIAEYETLPETARNAGAGFMDSVRARHAADDLVGKVLAAALRS